MKRKGIPGERVVLFVLLLASTVIFPAIADNVPPGPSEFDEEIAAMLDAAPEESPSSPDPRKEMQNMEEFISPAQNAIRAMKARNYSDNQITEILTIYGYGWEPGTGACWKGEAPTPEEQKIIDQARGQGYSPFPAFYWNIEESAFPRTIRLISHGFDIGLQDINAWSDVRMRLLRAVNPPGIVTTFEVPCPEGNTDCNPTDLSRVRDLGPSESMDLL